MGDTGKLPLVCSRLPKAHSAVTQRQPPPGSNPAARCERRKSGFQGVDPLAVLALGGRDRQPHLFPQRAGDEAAQRMRLPAGGLEQLFRARSAGPPQQVEDLGGLAAASGTRLGDLGFRAALMRFLRGGGLLSPAWASVTQRARDVLQDGAWWWASSRRSRGQAYYVR